MKPCPSTDPQDGMKCGFPEGHLGRCGNGVGHRCWDYHVKAPTVVENVEVNKERKKSER